MHQNGVQALAESHKTANDKELIRWETDYDKIDLS